MFQIDRINFNTRIVAIILATFTMLCRLGYNQNELVTKINNKRKKYNNDFIRLLDNLLNIYN